MTLKKSFVSTAAALSLLSACSSFADDADIYAIQFSEDGRHLITGGTGGELAGPKDDFTGGIKVWDAGNGELVHSMGSQTDLETVFGTDHGRVGKRRWGISSFKDVVMYGSYPNGKVLLLPSSLGHMTDVDSMETPTFIGGTMDFDNPAPRRIGLSKNSTGHGSCDDNPYMYDYIGPMVPSDNGHFAAIVVNTCHVKATAAKTADQGVSYEYKSTLHVMDLGAQKIISTHENIDAGVYALGISNDGANVAFVGRDRFAVVNADSGEMKVVEAYPDSDFVIPRQFSKLQFSQDGGKLVSLRFIYDIKTGTERPMTWMESDARKPKRITSVTFAPDLSYFVMVQKKQALIMFGEDGLPRSYGKADKVMVMNTETGEKLDLAITDSMTEGKRCVADVSPDSERVAVACKGGIMRMFNARNGELIWSKKNVSYKAQELGEHLMRVSNDILDGELPWLYSNLVLADHSFN